MHVLSEKVSKLEFTSTIYKYKFKQGNTNLKPVDGKELIARLCCTMVRIYREKSCKCGSTKLGSTALLARCGSNNLPSQTKNTSLDHM